MPPPTVGSDGAVRSSMTVSVASGVAGVHADTLPAASTERNCTSVVPSAEIATELPVAAADQVVPPFVDVRYW